MMVKGFPRFKPGDIVTVRSFEDMAASFPEECVRPNSISCPCEYDVEYVAGETPCCMFSADMKQLCGTQVTIRDALWLEEYEIYAYRIEEDDFNRDKFFVETMFEIEPNTEHVELGTADELFDFLLKGDNKS